MFVYPSRLYAAWQAEVDRGVVNTDIMQETSAVTKPFGYTSVVVATPITIAFSPRFKSYVSFKVVFQLCQGIKEKNL